MDKITVSDLEVFFQVGITSEERNQPQRLLISVEMETDFGQATRSDAITDTIDYGVVTNWLLRFGEQRSWALIETLAEEIATHILSQFKPSSVQVEIKKFIIPQARYVSVRLRRPNGPEA